MGDVVQFEGTRTTWQKTKDWCKAKMDWCKDKVNWCKENKELAIPIITTLIGCGTELVKAGMKYHDKAEEREVELKKKCSEWDPKTGSHLDITRPLTNTEKAEIARRTREEKITKTEILEEKGLLK